MAHRQRPRGRVITHAVRSLAVGTLAFSAGSAGAGASSPFGPPGSPSVTLTSLESTASFLHARNGELSNGNAIVNIGPGRTIVAIDWDLTITRIDPVTQFSDVGMGLLDLNGLPVITLPFDAPSFSLNGPSSRYDENGGMIWSQRVVGSFDLANFFIPSEGRTVDASIDTTDDGLFYLEVFEYWDDDDDYGVTASDTPLLPDAIVSGTVTFTLSVPAPAGTAALACGASLLGVSRGGRR